jgi:hypothetical protein
MKKITIGASSSMIKIHDLEKAFESGLLATNGYRQSAFADIKPLDPTTPPTARPRKSFFKRLLSKPSIHEPFVFKTRIDDPDWLTKLALNAAVCGFQAGTHIDRLARAAVYDTCYAANTWITPDENPRKTNTIIEVDNIIGIIPGESIYVGDTDRKPIEVRPHEVNKSTVPGGVSGSLVFAYEVFERLNRFGTPVRKLDFDAVSLPGSVSRNERVLPTLCMDDVEHVSHALSEGYVPKIESSHYNCYMDASTAHYYFGDAHFETEYDIRVRNIPFDGLVDKTRGIRYIIVPDTQDRIQMRRTIIAGRGVITENASTVPELGQDEEAFLINGVYLIKEVTRTHVSLTWHWNGSFDRQSKFVNGAYARRAQVIEHK